MDQTILVLENDDVSADQNLSNVMLEIIGARVRCAIMEPNSGFGRGLPKDLVGVVVGGGLPSVNDPKEWISDEIALIRQAVSLKLPILGICFGHQLLGKAFGVEVVRRDRKVGFADITKIAESPILKDFSDSWCSPIYHQDRLEQVPAGFELIATSEYCKVQGMQHQNLPIYSVQFHPEIHFGINERFADPVKEWDDEQAFESDSNLRLIDNFVDICLDI